MNNRDIRQANRALEELSQDPEAQRIARWREDQLRLYRMELATAEERGIEKGIERGIEKGIEKGLRGEVRTACELLGVDVGPERASALSATKSAELSALVAYLKQHRRWPEH